MVVGRTIKIISTFVRLSMRRQGVGLAGLLVLVVLLVAVSNLSVTGDPKKPGADTQSAPTKAQLDLARKAVAVVNNRCGSCHRFQVARGKSVPWGDDVPQLIKTRHVVPGDPDKSRLYTTPKNGHYKPTAADMTILHDWIEQGAVDPKAPPTPASKPTTKPMSRPTSEPATEPTAPPIKETPSWRHM
jgi:hypothetical protein